MIEGVWLSLSPREQTILLDALSSFRPTRRVSTNEIDALVLKLKHAEPYPKITVGVEGGQVQWAHGNPFPIWICDYDGVEELPDLDERAKPCTIWFEPAEDTAERFYSGDVNKT